MLSCYFLVPISLTGNFRKKTRTHTHIRYCFCNSVLESWILFLWVVPIWRNSWNSTLRKRILQKYIPYRGKFSLGKNFVGEKFRQFWKISHFSPTNFSNSSLFPDQFHFQFQFHFHLHFGIFVKTSLLNHDK